jgi:protein-S-isoprenylcysteine O-methyltransferase Ste14
VDLRTLGDFNGPTAALIRPTDRARRALRVAGVLLGVFAVVVAVPVGLAATLTQPAGSDHPQAAGVLAGVATLLACWVLLGLGAAWWDRRLCALDQRSWATEWERVEPVWSQRR